MSLGALARPCPRPAACQAREAAAKARGAAFFSRARADAIHVPELARPGRRARR